MTTMDDDNFETGFVNGIQFGIYSPEVVRSKSVVHITCETLYDSNGEPKINGLFDLRMGPIEPHVECKTCEQNYITCPGHFGHIELPKPVFNLQFETDIVKILRCICIKCNRLLLNKNDKIIKNIIALTKGNNKERFDKIFKLVQQKAKICGDINKKNETLYDNGGCGAIQPTKYNSNNFRSDYEIIAEWKDDNNDVPINISQKLNAEIVLSIFKRITEDDALVLGFSPKWCMPAWLIITILPVVPPSVRPSVRQYNSQRSEDDLTNKYYEIIKWTKMLKDKLAKNSVISLDTIKSYNSQIQHHVITLFNNDIKGIPQALTRGGRPMKTLRQRLAGKEGRIRNNLMGKRVDFSARSVISADANLAIEELGVPYKIAMNLTFPEVVNKININKLYQYVRNGNKVYPGAKSIKKIRDGRKYEILDNKDTSTITLELGDTVNRHLINGDIVLFNRQPSLHKMSMMAHKVRVMEGNTFRLNVDVCKPYNADFDGDEMNMHVPQSLQTSVELQYLAAVSKNIISPSSNSPIIGPAQDNLLGLFKLTDDNVYFTHQEMMNLLVSIEKFSGIIPEPEFNDGKLVKWTGKQLYSIILPPITYTQDLSKKKLKNIIIENGILKQGQIEKGACSNILHYIVNDYGTKEATRYLNDLQKIVSRYLIRSGFSVGISDLIVHKDIKKRNEEFILKGKKDVIELTKKVHLNILADLTENLDLLYDGKIAAINTKTVDNITNQIIKKMPLTNRINYIVTSGSKGKEMNIQQMMCLLGQQTIDQQRVPLGFSNRSLPHYPRFEDGIESRGFISSNFMNGLNPQEYFFHAMAGREGVIDTAVKTANSGYLQRRLVKSMEDLKVAHDFTVRSSNNDIVQFCYGYDGFNSVDLEKQKTNFIKIDITKLNTNYYIDVNDKFEYVMKSELSKMKKIENWKKIIIDYNKNIETIITDFHNIYTKFNKIDDIEIYYPVNFKRLILNTIKTFKLEDIGKSDLHPIEIIKELQELINYCRVGERRSLSCEILIWDNLAPKKLIRDIKINKIAFMHIINSIKARFKNSLAEGGEMVGPIAAQSIGEQSTQMTLNTFHHAGIGAQSSVTKGVPRLTEILSNTRSLKNNSYEIYLDEEHRFNAETADKIGNNLAMTTIGDILDSSAIYLEPNNNYDSVLPEDREFLEIYKLFSELDEQSVKIPENPWLIRLEFNRRKIIDKKITMEDIQIILKEHYPNASLMFMDDNSSKLVFRMRLNFESNKANDDILFMEYTIKDINDISIKGVDGITNVRIPNDDKDLTSIVVKENGSFVEKKEYKIITDGSKTLNTQILFDILIRKGIDANRTFSIDPNEMYSIFGIEAARFQIQYQLNKVLTDNGINISPRHLDLLCDKMCQNGDIMSVSRHGIKKENIGPLAKASFEETTDQLLEASLFGAFDNIKGVSSNIMVGQIPNCGTGDSVVLLDEDLLNTYENEEEIIEEEKFDVDSYFKTSEYCDGVGIKMSLNDIINNDGEYEEYEFCPDVIVE
jgi:DNA-directed RNA polymerase II subunit RPB1